MKIVLALILMMTFASCSQESGSTSAKLKVSMGAIAGAPANFPGGLMLYGRSGSGARSFGRVMSIDSIDEFIPNGVWHFYAVGWDGPNAMEGKVYCGHLANINLDGNPRQLNLNVTNGNCSNAIFGPNTNTVAGNKKFPEVQIETCNKLSHVSDSSASCDYNPGIAAPVNDKGYAASYKMILRSFDKVGPNYNVLNSKIESSRCSKVEDNTISGSLTAAGVTESQFLNMPIGSAITPFYTVMRAYYGSDDCDASGTSNKGFKNIVLKSGLSGDDFHYKAYTYDDVGTFKVKVFARVDEVDVCQGPRLAASGLPTKFAAGMGEFHHPYIICNAKQLNSIADENLSSGFKLAKDINLTLETKALNQSSSALCSSGGDNFTPIGGFTGAEVAAIGPACGTYSGTASIIFNGRFDGNNKKIKNMKLSLHDKDDIGFIRKVDAGEVLNLEFENAQVEGNSRVGTAIGSILDTSATQSKVIRVRVYSSKVDAGGGTDFGGVIGRAQKSTNDILIKNIHVKNTNIYSQGSGVGGIIGYASGVQASELAFDGFVAGQSNSVQDVGGIVGYLAAGSVQEIAVDGVIESQNQYLGGAVGRAAASTTIEHVAVRALVHNKLNTPGGSADVLKTGGVVGYFLGTPGSFEYGYFNGKILHSCNNATVSNCLIGAMSGDAGGYGSYVWVNEAVAISYGGTDGGDIGTYADHLDSSVAGIGADASTFTATQNFNYDGTGSSSSGRWRAMVNGFYPKLSFEDVHPCEDVTNLALITTQDDTRGGSASNPIRICSRAQMKSISDGTTLYYKLYDHLFLDALGSSEMVSLFNGDFNGNHKKLIAPSYSALSGQHSGVFASVSSGGNIYNLNVHGVQITGADASSKYRGGLAGTNSGLIEDVFVDILSDAEYFVGGIAGENSGTIKNSNVFGVMKGREHFGGVVSKNSTGAIIQGVISRVHLNAYPSFKSIAGISSLNEGQISKVSFYGAIDTGANTAAGADPFVGGIAANNDTSGTIQNSSVAYLSKIYTKSDEGVGGIVGNNVGGVTNSFSYAQVELNAVTPTVNTGGAVGVNTGSLSDVYYHTKAMELSSSGDSGITNVSCTTTTLELDLGVANPLHAAGTNDKLVKLENNNGHIFMKTIVSGNTALISNTIDQTISMTDNCVAEFNYTTVNKIEIFDTSTNIIADIATTEEIGQLDTYCADSTAGYTQAQKDNFVCQSGWDIINDDYGTARMLAFYTALFQGNPAPASTPIWEISSDFPNEPKLFGLKK